LNRLENDGINDKFHKEPEWPQRLIGMILKTSPLR
jgi:hypothetical protein